MIDPNVEARKMIALAETGAYAEWLKRLLLRHKEMDDQAWCPDCRRVAPCDTAILATALLGVLELVDGTRFSANWRGPVEERQ